MLPKLAIGLFYVQPCRSVIVFQGSLASKNNYVYSEAFLGRNQYKNFHGFTPKNKTLIKDIKTLLKHQASE